MLLKPQKLPLVLKRISIIQTRFLSHLGDYLCVHIPSLILKRLQLEEGLPQVGLREPVNQIAVVLGADQLDQVSALEFRELLGYWG